MFSKTKERLAAIETEQKGINKSINVIKTNDLPHIQKGVDKNSDKIDFLKYWLMGGLLTGLFTLLVLVVNVILHYI